MAARRRQDKNGYQIDIDERKETLNGYQNRYLRENNIEHTDRAAAARPSSRWRLKTSYVLSLK